MSNAVFISYPEKAIRIVPVQMQHEHTKLPYHIKYNPNIKLTVGGIMQFQSIDHNCYTDCMHNQHSSIAKAISDTFKQSASIGLSTAHLTNEEKLNKITKIKGNNSCIRYAHPYRKLTLQNTKRLDLSRIRNASFLSTPFPTDEQTEQLSEIKKQSKKHQILPKCYITPKIEGSFPSIYEEGEMNSLIKSWKPTKDDLRLTKKNWLRNLRDRLEGTDEIKENHCSFITAPANISTEDSKLSVSFDSKRDVNYLQRKITMIKPKHYNKLRLPVIKFVRKFGQKKSSPHKSLRTTMDISHASIIGDSYEKFMKYRKNMMRNELLIKYKTNEINSSIECAINSYKEQATCN